MFPVEHFILVAFFPALAKTLNQNLLEKSGGESGILLPPSPASDCETYSSAIIACICAGYKHIRSQAGVSIVSPVSPNSIENGIGRKGAKVVLALSRLAQNNLADPATFDL